MLVLTAWVLSGCDAGPSAVLPDKPDQVRDTEAPIQEPQSSNDIGGQGPTPKPEDRVTPKKATPKLGKYPLWSANKTYSAEENALYQYEQNGTAIGATSYDDYLARVHDFIHNPPKGVETLSRYNGDTLFYHEPSNIFAVMTKKGAPRTLFKPREGRAYWEEQKIIEAEKNKAKRAQSYAQP
jgi:hypothetical protein